MRYYPDGVAEGTPEEIAAYKHIDAALTAKGQRLALPAAKAPAKKAPAKKTAPKKRTRASRSAIAELNEMTYAFVAEHESVTSRDVAEFLEIHTEAARRRLRALHAAGWLSSPESGVYVAETRAEAVG